MTWLITKQQYMRIASEYFASSAPQEYSVVGNGIISHTPFLFGQGSVFSAYPRI